MNNKTCLITFEEFKKHIECIKELIAFEDNLRKVSRSYFVRREERFNLTFPTLMDNTISLLEILTGDNEAWIDYWVFELDCGNNYKDSCVQDKNGNNIPLKTIRDLWNVINMK